MVNKGKLTHKCGIEGSDGHHNRNSVATLKRNRTWKHRIPLGTRKYLNIKIPGTKNHAE